MNLRHFSMALAASFFLTTISGCPDTTSGNDTSSDVPSPEIRSEVGDDVPTDLPEDVTPEVEVTPPDIAVEVAPDLPPDIPDPSCDQGCCEFRAACETNGDCCSGRCLPKAKLCTKTCDQKACDVPGWSCKGVLEGTNLAFLCLPDETRLCEACTGDINCEGGVCTELGGTNVCTEPCGPKGTCPAGFECQDVTSVDASGETSQQCVPASGSCDCTPLTIGNKRSCEKSNDFGVCAGTQTCELVDQVSGATQWSFCNAELPVAEICDGVDNDCDGFADDAPAAPEEACEVTNDAGTCGGAWVCEGADGWACKAADPVAETCDLLDNDCDGETDEDFRDAATGLYVADEHCGACGANCVGIFPNATAGCQIDADSQGASCVVVSCDPGYFKASDTACVQVEDPSCQPCEADEDCLVPGNRCLTVEGGSFCARDCSDGNLYLVEAGECPAGYGCANVDTDQICLPLTNSCTCVDASQAGDERPCSVTSDEGTCGGIEACDPAQGWGNCSAATPVAESCNGLDDDCNGLVDDGAALPAEPCETTNVNGTCSSQWLCQGDQGWSCPAATPAAEACDGEDNDCDGAVDEDFRDPTTNLYTDDDHCGACGLSCVALFPNATGFCNSGSGTTVCEVQACDPGYYQVSATTCLEAVDTSCSPCLTDANCVVPGNSCLDIDGKSFCGRDCGADNLYGAEDSCPSGFSCVTQTDGTKQCMPDSNSCECLETDDVGSQRPCTRSNEFGTCVGFQLCEASTGWAACGASVPAAETCNGGDDDCDGLVDEGVIEPTDPCEVSNNAGVCSGSWSCGGAAGWQCDAPAPVAELCDGLDNDCDGETDEDFRDAATGLYVDFGNCGLCGNSCEGAVPYASSTACAIEDGIAACIAEACEPGFIKPAGTDRICVPESGSTTCSPCTEDSQCSTLQDGLCETIDNDKFCTASCTTPADCGPSGFDCTNNRCRPTTGSCTCFNPGDEGKQRLCNNTNAFGNCVGTETCDLSTGWTACNAKVPAAEVCDGTDDDCDNVVDEGFSVAPEACESTNAEGTCSGILVCQGSQGFVCTADVPEAEVCDRVDNNCDTVVDEPFVNAATGVYNSDAHCGVCGNSCASAIPNATATCVEANGAARCEVATCDTGFYKAGPLTCLPAVDALCAPCVSDVNCPTPGDACLTLDNASFCGRDCSDGNLHGIAAGVCPAGYQCADLGAQGEQCVPITDSCTCLPGDDGKARGCSASNAEGTCQGQQICDATGGTGWSSCDAPTPDVETCDAVDNDCNGVTDDVPNRGNSCVNTNAAGSCDGVLDCIDGQAALQCVGPTAALETCNGADDDCDGDVDETFTDLLSGCVVGDGACRRQGVRQCNAAGDATECSVEPGPIGTEVCDGIDNDCNGATDEAWPDLGTACTSGQGACTATGIYVCDTNNTAGPEVCNATPGGGGDESCNGLDDDCDGDTDEELVPPSCALTQGVCAGATQVCAGASGFIPCTVTRYGPTYEPNELSCDGLDNDCDGQVDVDAPDQPCALQAGVCAGAVKLCNPAIGFQDCTGPEYGANYESDEATCDYLDNDCDGAVDEHVKTGDKYTDQQNCGFCGNSCDNAIVNGTGTCDGSLAQPKCVVASCDSGFVQAGDTQCLPSTLGLCEPCVNSNDCLLPGASCVGLTDGNFCLNPCGASCPTGYSCGDPGTGANVCIPDTNACICNDSTVGLTKGCTENYSGTAGTYNCFGTETCGASGWSACVLPAEDCNLVDDNCDGVIDEGFVDGSGKYITDQNCGSCGNDCTGLNFPGTTGSCNTALDPPACQVQCTSTCFDVNNNPADGCECCDPAPNDFPDVGGIDANCDGLDGEKNNSVFVSKDGNDSNDGLTIATPKLTVQAGIDAASASSRRDVLVATGVYVEQVSLAAGVSVYGGYASGYATRDLVVYETAIVAPAPSGGRIGAVNAVSLTGAAAGTRLDGFSVFAYQDNTPGASSYGVYIFNSDSTVAITNNKIVGGSAGRGSRGGDGANGASGTNGQTGTDAKDVEESGGSTWDTCLASDASAGGAGGTNICGGVSTSGGDGGLRNCPVFDGGGSGVTAPPDSNEAGSAGSAGAAGGTAGWDVFHQAFSCSGYEVFGGIEGSDGVDGFDGVDGAAGTACADSSGVVTSGLWSANAGGPGVDGLDGDGGGGGGSGAGAHVWSSCGGNVAAGGCQSDSKWGNHNIGGTGGGGGSGACGATAGTAGTGGGGAFAIFVAWDAVPTGLPLIESNTIRLGFGGSGGDGGNAGVGGAGGAGGLGGIAGSDFDQGGCSYPSFKGGKGGNGGNGGHGGGGGGGCGGPSYGIFASGQGGSDLSAWSSANSFIAGGTGGAGGLGGFSLGNPGENGVDGATANTNF